MTCERHSPHHSVWLLAQSAVDSPQLRVEATTLDCGLSTADCRYIVPVLIAATTRLANSPALPWCQRHTTTRSWSGDTVMVLLPAPLAEYALVGSPASALPVVLSHHR